MYQNYGDDTSQLLASNRNLQVTNQLLVGNFLENTCRHMSCIFRGKNTGRHVTSILPGKITGQLLVRGPIRDKRITGNAIVRLPKLRACHIGETW